MPPPSLVPWVLLAAGASAVEPRMDGPAVMRRVLAHYAAASRVGTEITLRRLSDRVDKEASAMPGVLTLGEFDQLRFDFSGAHGVVVAMDGTTRRTVRTRDHSFECEKAAPGTGHTILYLFTGDARSVDQYSVTRIDDGDGADPSRSIRLRFHSKWPRGNPMASEVEIDPHTFAVRSLRWGGGDGPVAVLRFYEVRSGVRHPDAFFHPAPPPGTRVRRGGC